MAYPRQERYSQIDPSALGRQSLGEVMLEAALRVQELSIPPAGLRCVARFEDPAARAAAVTRALEILFTPGPDQRYAFFLADAELGWTDASLAYNAHTRQVA